MDKTMTIDGSQGEGGGQVLRTSLSLSAITGKGVRLVKIRAGREKPGLKRQHLTCVRAVAAICGAEVSDVEVGANELDFRPGPIRGGEYRFDVGTAGSVTLVAQTVIPVLLKADAPSSVTITGGTHVPFAPVWEFFAETYLPELRRMGARVEAEIESCGFYPAAGGVVKLRVWPFDAKDANQDWAVSPSARCRTWPAPLRKRRPRSSRTSSRRSGRTCAKWRRRDPATTAWRALTSNGRRLSSPKSGAMTVPARP